MGAPPTSSTTTITVTPIPRYPFPISQNYHHHNSSLRHHQSPLAGYTPVTQITDTAALDLDLQKLVERAGLNDITLAGHIYKHGGHSASYAVVELQDTTPPTRTFAAGTLVTGVSVSGGDVTGTLMHQVDSTTTELQIKYTTSNVQAKYVGCQVGALTDLQESNRNGCFADAGTIVLSEENKGAVTYSYQYNSRRDNLNGRTLQGFSRHAGTAMKSAFSGEYSYDYQMFLDYYGDVDYADKFVRAAERGNSTNFATSRGEANFQGMAAHGRAQAMAVGAAYLNVWMAVIQKMEEAIDLCRTGQDTTQSLHRLDQAAALYIGSLEGQDGSGQGNLMYDLADKRATQFRTAGYQSKRAHGTAWVNLELINFWLPAMQQALQSKNPDGTGQCEAVQEAKEEVVKRMLVPIVQSVLHNAWLRANKPDMAPLKTEVNGATFAAALLPYLHDCHPASAATIYKNMKIGSTSVNYAHVKQTLEEQYTCLGMSCAMVGGVWESGKYAAGGKPCTDGWSLIDRTPKNPDGTASSGGGSGSSNVLGSPASGSSDGGSNGAAGRAILFLFILLAGMAVAGLLFLRTSSSRKKRLGDGDHNVMETNIAAVSAVADVDLDLT